LIVVERTDFVSVPVTDLERSTRFCHMAFFRDPDGNALMLHRRCAPNE
jgi:hypothetical protein